MKRAITAVTLFLTLTSVFPQLSFAKEQTVQVNFDGVDIKDFTKIVSQATGKNFIVPEDLRGKVTVISPNPIPKRKLFDLYVAALDELGYQVVDYRGYFKIVRKREAVRESGEVKLGRVDGGDNILTSIIVPKRLNVLNVSSVVRNMLSSVGRVSFVRDVNAIVVTDKERNIHKIERVLRYLDVSPVKFQLVSFTFKNGSAENAERVLRAVLDRAFAFDLVRTFPVPGKDYYHFAVDRRTNTLYVVGTPNVIKRVSSLFKELDQPIKVEKGYIHLVNLNYSFAEDTARVLNQLFRGDVRRYGLTGDVRIVADKSNNALIVLASPQDFEVIKGIIKNIDVKRPQVFVEVQIVEMSMDKLLQMGVEWKFLSRGRLVPFGGSLYGNLPLKEGYPSGSPGLLLGLAKWRNGVPDIGLLLNAYAKEGGVNVIATPQILTLDNEEAEINISKVIPYSTGVKYDANNNPVISYDYKDVGITLKITPHITASGDVRLKIYEKVEDVVGYANADQTAPITSKREAKTTVDVQNGQTLVIGGLIKSKKLTTIEKVPILGNIPIFGNLFKKTGHQMEKTNLLVFITPHVVRTREEEEDLTKDRIRVYEENIRKIEKSRKGIFSDFKGFGEFKMEGVGIKDVK